MAGTSLGGHLIETMAGGSEIVEPAASMTDALLASTPTTAALTSHLRARCLTPLVTTCCPRIFRHAQAAHLARQGWTPRRSAPSRRGQGHAALSLALQTEGVLGKTWSRFALLPDLLQAQRYFVPHPAMRESRFREISVFVHKAGLTRVETPFDRISTEVKS